MTFNTFYSNICAKFRDLKSLTFLFLDLELVLISTRSIIKLKADFKAFRSMLTFHKIVHIVWVLRATV